MRLPYVKFCFIAVLLVLAGACSVTPPPPQPAAAVPVMNWNSPPAPQAFPQQGNRPKLMFLYSNGCPYCQEMKSVTLADPGVRAFIEQNFNAVQVNSEEAPQLFQTWSVETVPTTVILAPNGQRLQTLPGFMPPGPYLAALRATLGR